MGRRGHGEPTARNECRSSPRTRVRAEPISGLAAYCGDRAGSSLVTRRPLLMVLGPLAAVLLSACAPVGQASAEPSTAATAALPSATSVATNPPAPSLEAAPPVATGPSVDAVTGGEASAAATAERTPVPASIAPAAEPNPSPTPAPTTASADAEPFAMNLYRKGDFVAQYTFELCVGASLQMALNMATDGSHTTRAQQEELWGMARDLSFSPFGGANPRGWTAVLNELGIGPYELVSVPTLDAALTTAAEAMRATKRPVGLVMWRGRHAWVMSGFASTADPRRTDDFEVTGIRVLDPLYPHGSSMWGKSPKPNSLVSPATLAKQFVLRDVTRSRVNLGVPTGYLMIVPVDRSVG